MPTPSFAALVPQSHLTSQRTVCGKVYGNAVRVGSATNSMLPGVVTGRPRDFSVTWQRPSKASLLILTKWQRSYSGENSSSLTKTRWRTLWIMGNTLFFRAESPRVSPAGVTLFWEISFSSTAADLRSCSSGSLAADARDSAIVKTNLKPSSFGPCFRNKWLNLNSDCVALRLRSVFSVLVLETVSHQTDVT